MISDAFYVIVWIWYASFQIWYAKGVFSMQYLCGIKVPSRVLGMITMIWYAMFGILAVIGMLLSRDGDRLVYRDE